MRERLCLFCNHLQYEQAGTGEYAEPPMLNCAKGHNLKAQAKEWVDQGQYIFDLEDFRAMILTAQNCPDYDEAKL